MRAKFQDLPQKRCPEIGVCVTCYAISEILEYCLGSGCSDFNYTRVCELVKRSLKETC